MTRSYVTNVGILYEDDHFSFECIEIQEYKLAFRLAMIYWNIIFRR